MADIAQQALEIIKLIYDQVETMKANKNKCKTLVDRASSISKALENFDFSTGVTAKVDNILALYLSCVKEINQICLLYNDKNWFKRLIRAGDDHSRFKDLNEQLSNISVDLNLGLSIQQVFDQQKYREDDEKDKKEMEEVLEQLILINKKLDESDNAMASIRYNLHQLTAHASPAPRVNANPQYFLEIQPEDLEMGQELGHGEYGSVNKAVWKGTEVAAKLLIRLDKPDLIADFITEMNVLAGLHHPNILMLMCASTNLSKPIMVTELMDMNLRHAIENLASEITFERIISIAKQIVQGMLFLVKRDPHIHHRDLKSMNILVGRGWTIKICDFGLAKIREVTAKTISKAGTPQWSAPEVLDADAPYVLDLEKADVYSFGVVLWELLTKELPWANKKIGQVIFSVISGTNLTIPENTDPRIKNILEACWSTDPAERPAFQQLLVDLQKILPN